MKYKILIADDEQDIRELLNYLLTKDGFDVIEAKDGNEAIVMAKKHLPDLILLDYMMPIKNGLEVCKLLKSVVEFEKTPIIFLTAIADELNEVNSFESGAIDYVKKPIKPSILLTRIKAHLNLKAQLETDVKNQSILKFKNFEINKENYSVLFNATTYILTKKEFELLMLLASKPGKVFRRNEILDIVWGNEVYVGDRTIDVHIRKLRTKFGDEYISTLKGVGYKFDDEPVTE
jgi:two-component system alkaline phosphatase synthesis response regulator PhoP